jgi:hypothetical protein
MLCGKDVLNMWDVPKNVYLNINVKLKSNVTW